MAASKKHKSVSDEVIISALLTNRTIKQTAEALSVSERTVYERMHDNAFIARYQAAKTDILRETVGDVRKDIGAAMNVIKGIMLDENGIPADRLKAAQIYIGQAFRISEAIEAEESSSKITEQYKDLL